MTQNANANKTKKNTSLWKSPFFRCIFFCNQLFLLSTILNLKVVILQSKFFFDNQEFLFLQSKFFMTIKSFCFCNQNVFSKAKWHFEIKVFCDR